MFIKFYNRFFFIYLNGDNMFQIGDLVTRNSYDNDIVFKITKIEDEIYYLKGSNIRLYADSNESDLKKYEDKVDVEEKEFLDRIKPDMLDRNDYFYLPGKILHIDSDISLSNDLANPYKIRKKAKNENNINH